MDRERIDEHWRQRDMIQQGSEFHEDERESENERSVHGSPAPSTDATGRRSSASSVRTHSSTTSSHGDCCGGLQRPHHSKVETCNGHAIPENYCQQQIPHPYQMTNRNVMHQFHHPVQGNPFPPPMVSATSVNGYEQFQPPMAMQFMYAGGPLRPMMAVPMDPHPQLIPQLHCMLCQQRAVAGQPLGYCYACPTHYLIDQRNLAMQQQHHQQQIPRSSVPSTVIGDGHAQTTSTTTSPNVVWRTRYTDYQPVTTSVPVKHSSRESLRSTEECQKSPVLSANSSERLDATYVLPKQKQPIPERNVAALHTETWPQSQIQSESNQCVDESDARLDSDGNSQTNRFHLGSKLEKSHGRTPLFGERPAWWCQQGSGDESTDEWPMSSAENARSEVYPAQFIKKYATHKNEIVSDTEVTTNRLAMYKDRNSPTSLTQTKFENERQTAMSSRRSPHLPSTATSKGDGDSNDSEKQSGQSEGSMAFTIDFSDGNSSKALSSDKAKAAEQSWKAHSAERLHRNFIRRSLRKYDNVPPTRHSLGSQRRTTQNSLTKPMSNETTSNATTDVRFDDFLFPDSSHLSPGNSRSNNTNAERDIDVCSEAGTYIIEPNEDDAIEDVTAQGFSSDTDRCYAWLCDINGGGLLNEKGDLVSETLQENAADSSSMTVIKEKPSGVHPLVSSLIRKNEQGLKQTRAAEQPEQSGGISEFEDQKRQDLLKKLTKMSKPASATNVMPETRVVKPKPPTAAPPSRENIALQSRRAAALNKRASLGDSFVRHVSNSPDLNQRASLRSTQLQPAVAPKSLKPREQSGPVQLLKNVKPAPPIKESDTLKNWLRRKEYNPMKAAAEAKKNKSLSLSVKTTDVAPVPVKTTPQYLSDRSRSFHMGSIAAKTGLTPSALRKHPSVCDTTEQNIYDSDNDFLSIAKLTKSEVRTLDEDTLKDLATLSQELGQKAKYVLTKVADGIPPDSIYDGGASPTELDKRESHLLSPRQAEKEAALAALLNQLRVANQALEVIGKILPDDQTSGNAK